ncbi:unnamed protein product, partial [Musa textilis]
LATAPPQAQRLKEAQRHLLYSLSLPILKTWPPHSMNVNGTGQGVDVRAGGRIHLEPPADGEEMREQLLVHLREADREAEAEPSSTATAWPWKLRQRRRGSSAAVGFERRACATSPATVEKRAGWLRLGRMDRRERPNFSITLTTEEIEEDIYAVTGRRARRRPRKRPRVVQKQLDLLFPGSWLLEITIDSYRVPDQRGTVTSSAANLSCTATAIIAVRE